MRKTPLVRQPTHVSEKEANRSIEQMDDKLALDLLAKRRKCVAEVKLQKQNADVHMRNAGGVGCSPLPAPTRMIIHKKSGPPRNHEVV